MIPNWLLGKSKSKLQEILGGGGGGTTYTAGEGIDITNHEISVDPVLLSDISGMSDDIDLKAAKTQLSNHNILHNPWFTVNQRASGKITAGGKYPCDRWKAVGEGTLDVTATGNGLAIVNTSNETPVYIIQPRTTTTVNSLRTYNNKLTASVMLSNGTIYSGTAEVALGTVTYFENDDMKLSTIFNTTPGEVLRIEVKGGKSVTIRAIKLEVGEVSTLHLDPRPEYATELAKCQRYFNRFWYSEIGWAHCVAENRWSVIAHLPCGMRAAPTISLSANGVIGIQVATGDNRTGTPTINNYNEGGEPINIGFDLIGITGTVGEFGRVFIGNHYLYFDAEIS